MSQTTVPGPSKSRQIAELLERRIRHGDYHGRELPTERELADETGVSRMTSRKALQHLLDQGLLARMPNGRVVPDSTGCGRMRIAFLVPSVVSPDVEAWRLHLERLAADANATVRTMLYLHWDDPAIVDALESFEGIFVYPSCEAIPTWIIDRLREADRAVTVLGRDLTVHGIRSLNLFPPVFIQRLLDYVASLGHRAVDCFNVQTVDAIIEERIAQWDLWRTAHRMVGQLIGRPISPYEVPLAHAYEQATRLLGERAFTASAVFCTTAPAAIGLARAMRDRGIRIGIDKSIVVFNDEGLGRYMSPSLTSIEMPNPDAYLAVCIRSMQRAGEGWIGPLLMQPSDAPLFVGESTGPYVVDGAQP